jgi:hypothetical protein
MTANRGACSCTLLVVLASAGACATPGTAPPRRSATAGPAAPGSSGATGGLACGRNDNDILAPSLVPDDAYASRNGVMAARFSQLTTSVERPLEECGLRAVLQRLVALTCDDGSNPFRDRRAAHASRQGSKGAGGRCGQVIDVYVVNCPEKTYEVYADMYFCTEGVQSQFR